MREAAELHGDKYEGDYLLQDRELMDGAPGEPCTHGRTERILIVDDEPVIVEYLEQELQDLGYETVGAQTAQAALETVATKRPDLILLDIMMPGMNGLNVCRILKGNDETRLIPVIILTALDGFEARIRGTEAGADDFLTKPVDRRELVARIQTALQVKRTIDRKFAELCHVRDHLARFVPEAVRRGVFANPYAPELSKHQEDISVLFVDISGYARLSEQLPAGRLNLLVERYFSRYFDHIHEVGGDVTEMAGDGFMAIFQDADPHLHAMKAVDTALLLLATTDTLNQESGKHRLSIHIGINSGMALVGPTRFEGRRSTRWTFTANGSVTNLAARLAGVAPAGHILIGAETAQRVEAAFQLETIMRAPLKNTSEVTDLYRVVGRP